MKDVKYLERTASGQWRVSIRVPAHLVAVLNKTRVKRSLGTASLKEANRRKHAVIGELLAELQTIERQHQRELSAPPGRDELARMASELREALARANLEEREALLDAIGDLAELHQGTPVDHDRDGLPVFDAVKERQALRFVQVARGETVDWSELVEVFHAQKRLHPKTASKNLLALRRLAEYCTKHAIEHDMKAITRRTAAGFVVSLSESGLAASTVNNLVERLSSFWSWAIARGHLTGDSPWTSQSIEADEAEEREFTKEELHRLFSGPHDDDMWLLMAIGLTAGARLHVIATLTAGSARAGCFTFAAQKAEKSARTVPIHSALVEVVARRIEGQPDDSPLFPWSSSELAGKAFAEYRKSVGVDVRVPGKRRALTTFHSFRRTFVTVALQAGCPVHLVEACTGHRPAGTALRVYHGGASLEQLRSVVESIKLPCA